MRFLNNSMKRYFSPVLILALAFHSGLGVFVRGPTADHTVLFSKFDGARLSQLGSSLHHAPSAILLRPGAGNGPDEVHFGLRAMNFYGADLRHHRFSLDMVMSIKWTDPRVVSLIPTGIDKLTMSHVQAEKVMWMPGIVVSNRDIEKYEIISASVTIFRTGEVRRVERANTRIMKKFMLENYPFDMQTLDINLASSKYMADEVALVPSKEGSGVYENIFGLYALSNWSTDAVTKHDGELVKSRGALHIDVQRSLEKYGQDHLLPASIVLMISWAVFYFPFANPFITARLALSILALLTFTNLIVKSSKELPGAAPFNFNDLFNQQIQTLMFITIVLNITSEVAFHILRKEALARGLNHEAKVLMPFMSVLNIVLILGGGKWHWFSVQTATWLVQVSLVLLLSMYVGYAMNQQKKLEAQDAADLLSERRLPSPRKTKYDVNNCAVLAGMMDGSHTHRTDMTGETEENDVDGCGECG